MSAFSGTAMPAAPGGFGDNHLLRTHLVGHGFAHLLHTLGDPVTWSPETWRLVSTVIDRLCRAADEAFDELDRRLHAAIRDVGLLQQGGRS